MLDDPDRLADLRRDYPAALLLVALVGAGDVARALDAGADAVVGPAAPAELRARVGALLRRRGGVVPSSTRVGPLAIDFASRNAALDGRALALRPREFALLAILASEPGRVFTKAELRQACWYDGASKPTGRALETQVARLRRRLGSGAPMLVTVWSVGYRLSDRSS